MKRAVVLGGGGSLGAYELGAWRALRRLNVDYQMVTGTSIGSINAALMAQGDFDLAERLWSTITLDQVMLDGVNMYTQIEKYLNQGPELHAFLKSYARNRGADITPLIELIKRSIDESAVRATGVELGMVTVRFPTLTPLEIMLNEIPEGRLCDYLLASASCFPAFPVYRIDDLGYIDGGYYDNMPVNLALARGADEVVAVDLFAKPSHPAMVGRPWMTYIHPSQPLGSILLFDRPVLDRNILLGELDTLRAFGKVLGVHYSFDAPSVVSYQAEARHFSLAVAKWEDQMMVRRAVTRIVAGTPLSEALRSRLPLARAATDLDELLVGAEVLAEYAGLERVHLYALDAFNEALFQALPLEEARAVLAQEERDSLLPNKLEPKLAAVTLALLMREGLVSDTTLHAAARRPNDVLAACYLAEFLPAG